MDVEHPLPFIEALDRADYHAIGVLAVVAGLANYVGHKATLFFAGPLATSGESLQVLIAKALEAREMLLPSLNLMNPCSLCQSSGSAPLRRLVWAGIIDKPRSSEYVGDLLGFDWDWYGV
jgi:hypothetical protein